MLRRLQTETWEKRRRHKFVSRFFPHLIAVFFRLFFFLFGFNEPFSKFRKKLYLRVIISLRMCENVKFLKLYNDVLYESLKFCEMNFFSWNIASEQFFFLLEFLSELQQFRNI